MAAVKFETKHDIDHLIRRVDTLRSLLDDLISPKDWEELVPIWKRPGWTTPAEFRLVAGQLDAMVRLSEELVDMKKTLIEGSNLVEVRG